MHEMHTQVTADASRRAVAREPERPAVGALTVRTERRADVLVFWLSGALDKATSALLDREFDSQAGQATHVVLDLTALGFVDSSGLDTLVRTLRRRARTISGSPSGTDLMRDGARSSSPVTLDCVLGRRLAGADVRTNEDFFAHAMECADVDHQRPLVIDPEAPWMGASGQAAGASDVHSH